jgi:hypothetical protein
MKAKRVFLSLVIGMGWVMAMVMLLVMSSGMALAEADGPQGNDEIMLELVSQVGGGMRNVAVQGAYVYVGVGPRLVILDISNPANPMVVGRTPLLGSNVSAIEVAGDYVYLLADGLQVIAVVDPANPTPVGRYEVLGGYDIHVVGDYLYLAEYSILHVLSITDPISPTEVGRYGGYSMYAIQIAGDYAYIAGTSALTDTKNDSGLVVVSLADRSHPVEVGFYETSGFPEDLQVVGNYVYVASTLGFITFEGYLDVFVLDTPGAPREVGAVAIGPLIEDSSYASGLHVVGDYAYVSADYGGMVVISVADPANPIELGHLDTPGRAYDIAAAGDYAYVADQWGGLRVVSVVDRNVPSEVGSYVPAAAGEVNSIHVVGDYAYLGGGYGGLWVVSVADPEHPLNSGHVFLSGGFDSIEDVHVSGDYVYAADVLNGLKVFAVADKDNPTLVGRADTIEGGQSVYAAGGYAYLATSNEYIPDADANPSGLYIFAVSDPANPTPWASYQTAGGVQGVWGAGSYAYLAVEPPAMLQPGRFEVISMADPLYPTLTGFYTSTLLDELYDVQIIGDHAYIATGWGLWAVSVADPKAPELLGIEYEDTAHSVHVVGERAYLARDGVSVVSVADPTQFTELSTYPLGDAEDVYVAGDYVYVANGSGGLVVLRVVETSSIVGRVLDGRGAPVMGAHISAGAAYSATTDANGVYTITGLLAGTYTLTPTTPGYFWSPAHRTVTVPPGAGGQNFVGRHIQKQAMASTQQGSLSLGDRLTYTLRLIYHDDRSLGVYDPLPTYTHYISDSLTMPGLAYDAGSHVISGTLGITAGNLTTVTFAVQVGVMGTVDFAPTIVNRACVYLPDEGLAGCEWSNRVVNYTYVWPIYLPLVMR